MTGTISADTIRRDLSANVRGGNPSVNWASMGVGLARVKEVQSEELKVTLVVLTGESDVAEYAGVDLTLSHGGRRHCVGAMPERGDLCYVSWAVRESTGTASSRTPVIVGWAPPAAWMGHEWIPYQPMEPGEGMDTVRDRSVAAGTMDRTRFKLRHVSPGNVFASSSQGSDLILDAGVLLANRRGNELRLRDEDQAVVVRALQHFQALGGVRTYGGMVQREARLLPSTMWSDGVYWDAPKQTGAGQTPLARSALGVNPYPNGQLLPGLIFRRGPGDTESAFEAAREAIIPDILDPFDFLQWGGLVSANGTRQDTALPGGVSNTVYGGKPLYRVGLTANGTVDNAVSSWVSGQDSVPPPALTEYRVELTHTHDGTLPVTEQTDGFDADKLPGRPPTDGDPLALGGQPFLEWVLGSVVGNDPFSYLGRPLYGLPLRPTVFTESGDTNPALVSAVGFPLGDHAATLFRLTPPVPGPLPTGSTFTSFTKDGRFKAYIGGGPVSAEVATSGDLALAVGGTLRLNLRGGIDFRGSAGPGNVGLNLGSPTGAVVIQGGGTMDTGSAARDAVPGGMTGGDTPSVLIRGAQNVTMQSDGSIVMGAPTVNIANAGAVNVNAQSLLTLWSGGRVSVSTQNLDQVISGKEVTNYGGPPEGNPANGPTRTVTFSATPATGSIGGVTDRYKMVFGDREETFVLQGNHSTTLAVGNLTYETRLGKWKAAAGPNNIEIDSTNGVTETVGVGDRTTTVTTGGVTVTAQANVVTRSLTGTVTLSGAQGVVLKAPGTAAGDILCGSDLDPLTGLPYSTFLVPKLQKLGTV